MLKSFDANNFLSFLKNLRIETTSMNLDLTALIGENFFYSPAPVFKTKRNFFAWLYSFSQFNLIGAIFGVPVTT